MNKKERTLFNIQEDNKVFLKIMKDLGLKVISKMDKKCPKCGKVEKGFSYAMSGNPYSQNYYLCEKCKTAFFYLKTQVHYKLKGETGYDEWHVEKRKEGFMFR